MRAETFRAIEDLALTDPRVIVLASDPSPPFMSQLAAQYPDRLMIEGISEQAMVGMAAGLAAEGYYPFMIVIAVFATRRCYEQLLLDFGLHGFSGCMVGIGGGFTYAPLGPTHLAVDDLLLTTAIPGSTVVMPGDPSEAAALIAPLRCTKGLSYFRVGATMSPLAGLEGGIKLGDPRSLGDPAEVLLISCGSVTLEALPAVASLREAGICANLLHLHTLKPLDADAIRGRIAHSKILVCLEEHRVHGGLATSILTMLARSGAVTPLPAVVSIGVGDEFPKGYGAYSDYLGYYGLRCDAIVRRVKEVVAALPRGSGSLISTTASV